MDWELSGKEDEYHHRRPFFLNTVPKCSGTSQEVGGLGITPREKKAKTPKLLD